MNGAYYTQPKKKEKEKIACNNKEKHTQGMTTFGLNIYRWSTWCERWKENAKESKWTNAKRSRTEGESKRISCCCRSWLWGRFVSFLLDACQFGCLCHRFRSFARLRSVFISISFLRVRLSCSPCSRFFACLRVCVSFEYARESAYALCELKPSYTFSTLSSMTICTAI